MNSGKVLFTLSAVLCASAVATGIWGRDGFTMALSSMALILVIAAFLHSSGSVQRYTIVMSVSTAISAALMVTVASHDSLVVSGAVSELMWILLSAVIRGAPVIPMIMVFFFSTAAAFKASYNWAVVSSLGWAVGMGMLLPPYALILFVQRAELDSGIIANATIVIAAFVNLIMFIALSLVLRSVFRKNGYLITEKGLEAGK